MAFNPLLIITDLFLHFPNELCYGYLRFEGNGKIPLGIMKSGLDAMPLFLLDNLLNMIDKKLSIPFYNWNN